MKNTTQQILLSTLVLMAASCTTQQKTAWSTHDPNRPNPPVITPGCTNTDPPSDAVILFGGSDLSAWQAVKGGEAKWKVENGYMQVVPKTGDIQTKESFGSCQLHIEWATPKIANGNGQGRGNSGVFLMGKYEVQVLDSYQNTTYADGQAGAIYGQSPPLVNVCRGPGQWQAYDIFFHAPVFDGNKLVKPATITILQNGVLIQDHWEIKGTTFWKQVPYYEPHAAKLPLGLQDHSNPTRFRNIWIRRLKD